MWKLWDKKGELDFGKVKRGWNEILQSAMGGSFSENFQLKERLFNSLLFLIKCCFDGK